MTKKHSMGDGLAELQQRTNEYAARVAAQRAGVGAPTQEEATGQRMVEDARRAQAEEQRYRFGQIDDEDDEPQAPSRGPARSQEDADPPDLDEGGWDELADELEGKAEKKPAEKPAEKGTQPDARKRALDRLNVPDALRKTLEGVEPAVLDGWLERLVQDQSKTDGAFQARDQQLSQLRRELDELKQGMTQGRGRKPSNARDLGDPSDEAGDPDEDLEGLRDVDPDVATALAKRDRETKQLRVALHKAQTRLEEVAKVHDQQLAVARRDMVQRAIGDLQSELGPMYPSLNDISYVRQHIVPRARALVTSGVAADLATALREAAHAANADTLEVDHASFMGRPAARVAKGQTEGQPAAKKSSTPVQAATLYFKLREQHPDWTEARIRAEAKRRSGRITEEQPYLR
jgi:hypothetical protein